MFDVDLFVLGGGSGGVRAARIAAGHGARVAIAEAYRWGGTCVIRGCVPKKLLVYASEVSRTLADAPGFGWTIDGARFDWPTLVAAKDREIGRLSEIYVGLMRKAGARTFDGRARLVGDHTVEVGGERITAGHILIATGGEPIAPDVPGDATWITSNEAFHLPALPARIAILGGGYVAVEFAHIFAGLGSKVDLIARSGVLRGFDPDVRTHVERGLRAHGVTLHAGIDVARATAHGTTELTLRDRTVLEVEVAMAAIGRRPMTSDLGLAEQGVALTAGGAVVVDAWSRSSVPHVYAVGDVTGRAALTPIAIREGHAFADTVFGNRPTAIDHDLIPTAVFAQPPAATIGLTEPAAADRGHQVEIFRATFRPMRYTLAGRDEQVLIKVVVDKPSGKVLGVHMVGLDAPEIIQAVAIAVTMGATKADLDRTFAIHPTTAEELVLLR
jgi:glutathione reductase (NADPH)